MILDNLLFGPAKLTCWLTQKLVDAAEQEMTDESVVRQELLELQIAFELGDITEEDLQQQEEVLLERLQWIRDIKKQQGPA